MSFLTPVECWYADKLCLCKCFIDSEMYGFSNILDHHCQVFFTAGEGLHVCCV
jgi:hypothetical protein